MKESLSQHLHRLYRERACDGRYKAEFVVLTNEQRNELMNDFVPVGKNLPFEDGSKYMGMTIIHPDKVITP